MQSPQHHTGMTAAALAKQRPRQLLPLPQPIPAALDTRVKSVQGVEAVLTSMRGRLQVRVELSEVTRQWDTDLE
jgi:hypothetical protein